MPDNNEIYRNKEGKSIIDWQAAILSPVCTIVLWLFLSQRVSAQSWHEVSQQSRVSIHIIMDCISSADNHTPDTARRNGTPVLVCIRNQASKVVFANFYRSHGEAEAVLNKYKEDKSLLITKIDIMQFPPKDQNPLNNFR